MREMWERPASADDTGSPGSPDSPDSPDAADAADDAMLDDATFEDVAPDELDDTAVFEPLRGGEALDTAVFEDLRLPDDTVVMEPIDEPAVELVPARRPAHRPSRSPGEPAPRPSSWERPWGSVRGPSRPEPAGCLECHGGPVDSDGPGCAGPSASHAPVLVRWHPLDLARKEEPDELEALWPELPAQRAARLARARRASSASWAQHAARALREPGPLERDPRHAVPRQHAPGFSSKVLLAGWGVLFALIAGLMVYFE